MSRSGRITTDEIRVLRRRVTVARTVRQDSRTYDAEVDPLEVLRALDEEQRQALAEIIHRVAHDYDTRRIVTESSADLIVSAICGDPRPRAQHAA